MTDRILTEAAEDDNADFIAEYDGGNCSCHISPPCGSCTHPGNPLNQAEDESCWQPAAPAFDIMQSIRDMVGGK